MRVATTTRLNKPVFRWFAGLGRARRSLHRRGLGPAAACGSPAAKVGTLDPRTGEIHVRRLSEKIENSFAVASDGVYIVSDRRMYRFKTGRSGRPRVVWKARYPRSGLRPRRRPRRRWRLQEGLHQHRGPRPERRPEALDQNWAGSVGGRRPRDGCAGSVGGRRPGTAAPRKTSGDPGATSPTAVRVRCVNCHRIGTWRFPSVRRELPASADGISLAASDE